MEFHIHSPAYYSDLRLLAMDLSIDSHPMVEVSLADSKTGPDVTLQVPVKTLEHKLQKGHHYRWVLISTEYPDIKVYSDALFQW